MEYVLRKTDIFDKKIGVKLNKAIKQDKENFFSGTAYQVTVSFHVDLLYDPRFEEFVVPVPSKTNKGTKEDKISDVLSSQLGEIEKILNENGIEAYSMTIQGEYLEGEDIIKIEIFEDTSKPFFTGRGKNKKRMKCHSIVPSRPYIQDTTAKLAAEKLAKMYYDLMNLIKDKKLMSEILEIDETQDDKKLITAFAKQYGDLWLSTEEKKRELLGRLEERMLLVVDKHFNKELEV